ncbi:MAG: NAD(P)/FAD-dependent oxidoreductase [Thermoplasmatota archaeon]
MSTYWRKQVQTGPDIFDIAVIGGGPAGTSAAAVAARTGMSTILLEAKSEIGTPVQCGEGLSDRALKYSGLGDGKWIVHPIDGYRLFSPSGGYVGSKTNGFSIDRHLFDSELGRIAEAEGCIMRLSANVVSADREGDHWKLRTKDGMVQTRGVVLATGPMSHLNNTFGLTRNIEMMRGIGAKISRKDASTKMDFYVKEELQGGYGWYFPRGKEVNIGIAARNDLKKWFEWFKRRLNIKESEIISYHGGIVPDGGPIEKFVGDAVVAAGDCGGFSHPVSKGGIYCAMVSGREASKAMAEHLSGNSRALPDLDRNLRSHPGFSMANIKRRDFLASLSDRDLDGITSLAKGRDIQTIDRKRIALEAITRPDLYPLIKKGLTMVQKGRDWLDYTF